MRLLGSLLRPGWLAVPVALLALAGGATAAAASPSHAAGPARTSTAAPLAWHALTLEDGWKSTSTRSLPTGTPAWAVRDGVVYLRGGIRQASKTGNDVFAVLPQAAWPAHELYLEVYTNGDMPGILFVSTNGEMEAYDGNSGAFTSLAGVSYLTQAGPATDLALMNGWQSSQPDYGTGDPAYSVRDGVAYLSGSMHTAGPSRLAFVLPQAARPSAGMYVGMYTRDGTSGWLHVLPTGKVYANGLDATGYTGLAGISFPVAGARWRKLTLTAGWKSAAGLFSSAPPEYAVINGVVYLNGSMHQPASGSGLWTFLPAAARTTGDVADIETDMSKGAPGAVSVTKSRGIVSSEPFSSARAFTSLAGIAYPRSS